MASVVTLQRLMRLVLKQKELQAKLQLQKANLSHT